MIVAVEGIDRLGKAFIALVGGLCFVYVVNKQKNEEELNRMKNDIYELVVNHNKPGDDSDKAYEVMRIFRRDTGEIAARVFYCKNSYRLNGYHFYTRPIDDNEVGIIFDDLYLDMTNNKPREFEAMLMHELGHMINGDLDVNNHIDLREERIINILNGIVDPKELAADRFAVEHCGKNAVIRMLDHIIAIRKRRNTVDGLIAIKELELRKQAAQRFS